MLVFRHNLLQLRVDRRGDVLDAAGDLPLHVREDHLVAYLLQVLLVPRIQPPIPGPILERGLGGKAL
jgi:hypothetical protein